MATIRIESTEDAVAGIAAQVTKYVASLCIEGHDLETVGRIVTCDASLQAIRHSFTRNVEKGMDAKAAFIATGQACLASYLNSAGIPVEG